ncbi:MAG: tRNA pseudouridine(38-40) synthase TruA [Muribaculaceae bacterium]|nr:tRNA pseudouridine(38-40) synthase TruA [Muribaculaceae bacterium]
MATPTLKKTDTVVAQQRYFMQLSYRGAPFHGWQSQPNAVSVQSTIEKAIFTVMRYPVRITGAGRTDTGVNARKMIAHFDLVEPHPHPDSLVRAINSLVGHDIAIESLTPVHPDAHARFDATSRTYHYYAHSGKSPFLHHLSWQAPATLDYEIMNRAADQLLSVEDFTSFAKLHTDVKTNICHVTHASWQPCGDNRMVFVITADRFLRNMVRAVVGTLVEVGRGKMTLDDFAAVISAKDRCAAGSSMPAHALYLWDVTYPYF